LAVTSFFIGAPPVPNPDKPEPKYFRQDNWMTWIYYPVIPSK